MRKLDSPKSRLDSLTIQSKSSIQSYEIKLVTPMFGGGSGAGQVDESSPIHVGSIRGNLRFWWRATRGAAFKTSYELRQREVEIFGDTLQPSALKIWIEQVNHDGVKSYEPQRNDKNSPYPPYLFQKVNDGSQRSKSINYIQNCSFTLCMQWSQTVLSFKETNPEEFKRLELDRNAALWAWINFGGIGSRARRGCGSLFCNGISPEKHLDSSEKFKKWLNKKIKDLDLRNIELEDSIREWPTLSGKVLVTGIVDSNYKMIDWTFGKYKEPGKKLTGSWSKTIECYRKFRHKANKPMGRSLWPEPDSIREITGMKELKHRLPHPDIKPNTLVSFPRAQFGLPIIFKFKQDQYLDKLHSKDREPYAAQLLPKGKTRLASPLILKTIATQQDKGFGAIVVLNQPTLSELDLDLIPIDVRNLSKQDKVHVEDVSKKLSSKEIKREEIYPKASYPGSPMRDRSNQKHTYDSAINAFLNSQEVENFCRVPHRNPNRLKNQ